SVARSASCFCSRRATRSSSRLTLSPSFEPAIALLSSAMRSAMKSRRVSSDTGSRAKAEAVRTTASQSPVAQRATKDLRPAAVAAEAGGQARQAQVRAVVGGQDGPVEQTVVGLGEAVPPGRVLPHPCREALTEGLLLLPGRDRLRRVQHPAAVVEGVVDRRR